LQALAKAPKPEVTPVQAETEQTEA